VALRRCGLGWMAFNLRLRERPRMAVVQSRLPWHLAGAAHSLKVPFIRALVLDSVEPMAQLVSQLNTFQPHVFGGYAGNVHLLAEEQIAGRLHIAPKTILTTAETLKKEARKAIKKAWGIEPFEAYGATETAEVASECQEHNGLHIYDDMAILEVVDRDNKPVPAGTYGSKILVTVLWKHSIPLIRYELSDHIKLAAKPCTCGRPFPLIEEVQGREEQVIHLTGKDGAEIAVDPEFFFDEMVLLPIDGWQIVQESEDTIICLILRPHSTFNELAFAKRSTGELERQGAKTPMVKVERIEELRRTRVGKVITIQALSKTHVK